MRELLKRVVHIWPWPLTLNEKYDRETRAVIKKVCRPDSVCVDVGAYHGEILSLMIAYAPLARHLAFEPVPEEYIRLRNTYEHRAEIYPYALGNENQESTFNHVITNPTYSGLQPREYKHEETIEKIIVPVRRLDDIIGDRVKVHLIKIDVEGGEYDVFRGAEKILMRDHPYLIFEHGKGGADKYGVSPGDVFGLLHDRLGYRVCLMEDFLKNEDTKGFDLEEFEEQFWGGRNSYFMAFAG